MITPPRILFILKQKNNYAGSTNSTAPSGLHNSAKFVSDMLSSLGIENKLVHVIDNNCIDREVHQYQPTHVIIEALWVVPEKFEVLQRLHPSVKWIVRIHSNLPFLAGEGVALDWILKYVQQPNVSVATNAIDSLNDIRYIISQHNYPILKDKVIYLPNYYPLNQVFTAAPKSYKELNVACFGAIRPLKNQLIQAVAAKKYADSVGRKLRFHINGTRNEQGGENNLKNIRAMFASWKDSAELVEHSWLSHDEFLTALSACDISLCVSFTETFCIVAADSILVGVPVVGSEEITWLSSFSQAHSTDSDDIAKKMSWAGSWLRGSLLKKVNRYSLEDYSEDTAKAWLSYLGFSWSLY